jgi:hypothetical protein
MYSTDRTVGGSSTYRGDYGEGVMLFIRDENYENEIPVWLDRLRALRLMSTIATAHSRYWDKEAEQPKLEGECVAETLHELGMVPDIDINDQGELRLGWGEADYRTGTFKYPLPDHLYENYQTVIDEYISILQAEEWYEEQKDNWN